MIFEGLGDDALEIVERAREKYILHPAGIDASGSA